MIDFRNLDDPIGGRKIVASAVHARSMNRYTSVDREFNPNLKAFPSNAGQIGRADLAGRVCRDEPKPVAICPRIYLWIDVDEAHCRKMPPTKVSGNRQSFAT